MDMSKGGGGEVCESNHTTQREIGNATAASALTSAEGLRVSFTGKARDEILEIRTERGGAGGALSTKKTHAFT